MAGSFSSICSHQLLCRISAPHICDIYLLRPIRLNSEISTRQLPTRASIVWPHASGTIPRLLRYIDIFTSRNSYFSRLGYIQDRFLHFEAPSSYCDWRPLKPHQRRHLNMRLLERKDSGEIRLTEEFIDHIPVYAILSHTWGADSQEVNFKDFVAGSGQSKAGYQKIQFVQSRLLAMVSDISGLTPVVSTNQIIASYQRLSILCFADILKQLDVMCTCRMF